MTSAPFLASPPSPAQVSPAWDAKQFQDVRTTWMIQTMDIQRYTISWYHDEFEVEFYLPCQDMFLWSCHVLSEGEENANDTSFNFQESKVVFHQELHP